MKIEPNNVNYDVSSIRVKLIETKFNSVSNNRVITITCFCYKDIFTGEYCVILKDGKKFAENIYILLQDICKNIT